MRLVKFLRICFERFEARDLVYESEPILRGELSALDQFVSRAERQKSRGRFAIEDLLFDEFFEAEGFSELHDEFLRKRLEEEQPEPAESRGQSVESTHYEDKRGAPSQESKASLLSEAVESGPAGEWEGRTSFFGESGKTIYENFERFLEGKVTEQKQRLLRNIDVIQKKSPWNQERRRVFLGFLEETLKAGTHVLSEK